MWTTETEDLNGPDRRRARAGRFVQSGRASFFPVPVLRTSRFRSTYGKNGYVQAGAQVPTEYSKGNFISTEYVVCTRRCYCY